ncbi:hypothetical protein EDD86DRAFT_245316, partial [Gorgonomyces haynaldii]
MHLSTICDFHISYLGCKNQQDFLQWDLVFICLHILQFILAITFSLKRLYRYKYLMKKTFREYMNYADRLVLLLAVYSSLRIGFLLHLRYPDDPVVFFRTSIYLDYSVWLIGGITANIVVKSMVEVADCITVFGIVVDPASVLQTVRVIYAVLSLVFFSLWAFPGLTSIQEYTLWRRCSYALSSSVSFCISAPTLLFFGNKILRTLKKRVSENVSKKSHPNSLELKSAFDQASQQHHLRILRSSIWTVAIVVYLGTGLYTIFYIIGFEFYTDESVLLVWKILCNTMLWICTSIFLVNFVPPDAVYFFNISDVTAYNQEEGESWSDIYNYLWLDTCGRLPSNLIGLGCCWSFKQGIFGNYQAGMTQIIDRPNNVNQLPTTTNGGSFCAMTARDADALLGFSGLYVKATGDCVQGYLRCMPSGDLHYYNFTGTFGVDDGCPGSPVETLGLSSQWQNVQSTVLGNIRARIYTVTDAGLPISWFHYFPQTQLFWS